MEYRIKNTKKPSETLMKFPEPVIPWKPAYDPQSYRLYLLGILDKEGNLRPYLPLNKNTEYETLWRYYAKYENRFNYGKVPTEGERKEAREG